MSLQDDIFNGESDTLEFKEKIPADTSKIVRTAVAFSNTQGGRIIIGVSDDRKIVGISDDPFKIRDQVVDIIIKGCEPTVSFDSYIITIDGKNLVVIEISPGILRPYYIKGGKPERDTFLRTSASNRTPSDGMLKELELEGARRSFDSLKYIERYDTFDKDAESLCQYISCKSGKDVDFNKLENLGLIINTPSGYVPSRAFVLLTSNPYFYASVQCARFRGNNMIEFVDRKEFGGSLMNQIDEAVNFVMNNVNLSGVIKGLYREDTPEVPVEAVRELITNAIIHRSYGIENNYTFVAVFDDRIEITSPGMLPFGLSIDKAISGRSNPRNPIIAKFFRECKLVEGWGSGIGRSFSLCTEHGLKEPVIQELDEALRVTIFRKDSSHVPSEDPISLPLSEIEIKIIEEIERIPILRLTN
ncbi:MAG: putative DNA binding domain-containing protein [Candidatus Methanomethylophilaceae archaeon]|nr:putative DNA binding domain-containing protein [Candidatus Methanomethylophilaceae archaeon]